MIITPIQTDAIRPGITTLTDLIDAAITELPESSIVVVTSKIVSICEGRVVPISQNDREALIRQESDFYLPPEQSRYGHHFSIVEGTLLGSAGIDESNGDGNYVLLPADMQGTVNRIRAHLRQRFGHADLGVILTDSASHPLRLGAMSVALAHSGFQALHNYIGQQDLFGHPYGVTRANIAGGLAAAAGVVMGEGNERTPFCVLSDLPFVTFQDADPTAEELQSIRLDMRTDLFAPFLEPAEWQKGGRNPR
jgi:F420-0:gamma-glutamyl ligase